MAAKVFIAQNVRSGKIEHIDIVPHESNDMFCCLGCGEQLIKVKSIPRLRDWHFRHYNQSDCQGAKDKALHDLAVRLILENNAIELPKNLSLSYSNQRKEVSIGSYRSDATVTVEDFDVHVEVFVRNDLSQEKVNYYQSEKIKCVKIDLSDRKLLNANFEDIKFQVLQNIVNKKIIYWNEPSVVQSPPQDQPGSNNTGCFLLFIFFVFIAYLGLSSEDQEKPQPRIKRK